MCLLRATKIRLNERCMFSTLSRSRRRWKTGEEVRRRLKNVDDDGGCGDVGGARLLCRHFICGRRPKTELSSKRLRARVRALGWLLACVYLRSCSRARVRMRVGDRFSRGHAATNSLTSGARRSFTCCLRAAQRRKCACIWETRTLQNESFFFLVFLEVERARARACSLTTAIVDNNRERGTGNNGGFSIIIDSSSKKEINFGNGKQTVNSYAIQIDSFLITSYCSTLAAIRVSPPSCRNCGAFDFSLSVSGNDSRIMLKMGFFAAASGSGMLSGASVRRISSSPGNVSSGLSALWRSI